MSGLKLMAAVLAGACFAPAAAAQQKVELPAKDRPLEISTRTLFTVGAVDGEDHENFAMVLDVGFDARGNLYVLDAQAHRVVVFDPQGRFLRSIGREGGGPGEFTFPNGMAVFPDGSLLVNDGARASMQLFNPGGEFVRTVSLHEDLGRAIGRMRLAGNGTIIAETARFGAGRRERQGNRVTMPPRSITALALGDTVSGTRLFNAPPRELNLSTPQATDGGTTRFSMALTAFEPQLLWTPFGDGGIAASHSAAYRVALTDAQGRPLRYLERAIEPRAVTGRDRERWLEQRNGDGAGSGVMVMSSSRSGSAPRSAAPPVMRVEAGEIDEQSVNWGDVIPVVSALGTDSFGRLWIQRTGSDLRDGPIDIIDAGLRYLGTLAPQELPRAFGPDGRLAYIVRDELDVQRVVVSQIAP